MLRITMPTAVIQLLDIHAHDTAELKVILDEEDPRLEVRFKEKTEEN